MNSDPVRITCSHCDTTNRLPRTKLVDKPICGKCHEQIFTGSPLILTDANFPKTINNTDIPLIVDFWAPWCQPCISMAPAFAQTTAAFEPHIRFGKLDTESAPEVAQRYNIRSIPTLIVFKGGKEAKRESGALDLSSLKRFVDTIH